MACSVSWEKLENLGKYFHNEENNLRWPSVFVLPGWLEAWWKSFGSGYQQLVLVVSENSEVIGIAPLKVKDGTASFIGDNSVCDYLDIIVSSGKEDVFSDCILEHLKGVGIESLVLETLRPDSFAGHNVVERARLSGRMVSCSPIDVSFEMFLPSAWEEYLVSLESKQRRDVERKIRQLENVAEVRFDVSCNHEVGKAELNTFFSMMADSRRDKAQFLTADMRAFFENIVSAMSDYGLLRLAFLSVGVAKVAGILYFEYNDRIYLYNSGYNPQFADMNVGLVSKSYCIRRAISARKKVFDFLKGPEVYKSRLGGRETELSRCVIDLI